MMRLAFFLAVLTLAAGCVLEDKPVIPDDGGVEAGPCGICPLATPVCNVDNLQCVECTSEDEGFCAGKPLVCKTDTFGCVECNTSSDCNDADAARCDTDLNECDSCQSDDDCTGITGLLRCGEGVCAACTPGTEADDCTGNSCDPATFTCTGTMLASRETCQTCVSDSECKEAGNRCVAMFYPLGTRFPDDNTGFCLKVFAPGGCEQPYAIRISNRESLSGDPLESYCGINEALATCLAVRALNGNDTCPGGNDSECPDSGLCRDVGGLPNRCTYPCASVVECLENIPDGRPGSTCGSSSSSSDDYCGG